MPKHENEVSDKRVESISFPRLDEGSNPSWSTNRVSTTYNRIFMDRDKRKEKLATFFFDLSKVCFTGLVIGVIIILAGDFTNIRMWAVLIFGIASTTMFALIANKFLK